MNRLDDKNKELLDQYDINIFSNYRFRGASFLASSHGLCKLRSYSGTEKRQGFEAAVKTHIASLGYKNIDLTLQTREGTYLCTNQYGENFVLCSWMEGEEASIQDTSHLCALAENLAHLHKCMTNFESDEFDIPHYSQSSLSDVLMRRTRELHRVHGYIRTKKQRNTFEALYLLSCQDFFKQAEEACGLLKTFDYEQYFNNSLKNRELYHGSYTHHSVLLGSNGAFTFNFDKTEYGIQITDLYMLLRKAMEKNNWNLDLCMTLINKYNAIRSLPRESLKTLYIMMLYPEKFWKITNRYINSKKTWIPGRNLQKLNDVINRFEQRTDFLRSLRPIIFDD